MLYRLVVASYAVCTSPHPSQANIVGHTRLRQVLLGTEVSAMVGQDEAALMGAVKQVEGVMGANLTRAALDRLKAAEEVRVCGAPSLGSVHEMEV